MLMPAWDSIDGASRVSFWCHIAALAFVFFLAVSEIFAFVYGERYEALIKARDGAIAIQRQNEENAAHERRKMEVDVLEKKLATADQRISELRQFQAQRHLTEEQRREFVAVMSQFKGTKVSLSSILGDEESRSYRNDFESVFRSSGWNIAAIGEGISVKNLVGIVVHANPGSTPEVLNALGAFLATLGHFKIIDSLPNGKFFVERNTQTPTDRIDVIVGVKRRP